MLFGEFGILSLMTWAGDCDEGDEKGIIDQLLEWYIGDEIFDENHLFDLLSASV